MPERDELEERLARLPLCGLGPARDADIVRAIRTTGHPKTFWWARRIAVWQAAAACLLVGLAVAVAMRGLTLPPGYTRSAASPPPQPSVVVRVDAPILARADAPRVPDLSRWRSLVEHNPGDPR